MNQNKVLLIIATILIVLGIFKPNLSDLNIIATPNAVHSLENYVVDAPSDTELLDRASIVKNIFLASDDSTRKSDCLKLSALYSDLAVLIELDDADVVVKSTATIREANALSGKMLRLDISNKYLNLSQACQDVIVAAIGDDDVLLNEILRKKAAEGFRALSWACYEGSK